MKMKPQDFAALKEAIGHVKRKNDRSFEQIKTDYLNDGLTERRFRFDVLWAIPSKIRQSWFDRGVYGYLNDDHIHTALKKILT